MDNKEQNSAISNKQKPKAENTNSARRKERLKEALRKNLRRRKNSDK
jgi:hypothetical protein